MASKNSNKVKDYSEIEEVEEIITEPFSKKVMLNYTGIVKLITPLGNQYVWNGGGDVLVIENELDFDYIISRELPKSCCGKRLQQFMFLEI